jgi:Na+/proline symporter
MDTIWFKILAGIQYFKDFLDVIFGPLNALGPILAISAIALVAVVIAKVLTRTFKTKRYKELQKEFTHWFNIRQEAMKCEDREKARLLAKNIDQAKLNRLYYDYFFEGLLNSIATKYLPILIFLAYVNETYQPGNLLNQFGREYLFQIGNAGENPILVGSIFWFVVSILSLYLLAYMAKKIFHKVVPPKVQTA